MKFFTALEKHIDRRTGQLQSHFLDNESVFLEAPSGGK
jgi:hypothetical protein